MYWLAVEGRSSSVIAAVSFSVEKLTDFILCSIELRYVAAETN